MRFFSFPFFFPKEDHYCIEFLFDFCDVALCLNCFPLFDEEVENYSLPIKEKN